MNNRPLKNIAASVRQRLLNQAHESARPFIELLQYFAMERFLYRLGISPHNQEFVLKGALLLRAWDAPGNRPTMDIDLPGFTDNDINNIAEIVKSICDVESINDGLEFNATSVVSSPIKKDADYGGVRIRFQGKLGNARIPMQIDVGFGDSVYPGIVNLDYPTLLEFPAPELCGYPRESVIAEKVEAMVKLCRLNSRLKDFYDVQLLARRFDFDGESLYFAFEKTFTNRGTHPVIFENMATEILKNSNLELKWGGFLKKTGINAQDSFAQVLETMETFLKPVLESLVNGQTFKKKWNTPGPWLSGKEHVQEMSPH